MMFNKSNSINTFIISYILLECKSAIAGSRQQQFTGLRRNGFKLKSDVILDKVNAIDSIHCASECISLVSCRTISWNEQQKLCLVSSSDVTHDNNAFDKLSEDASWNTMSVVEYTAIAGSRQQQFTGLRRNGFKLKSDVILDKVNAIDSIHCASECISLVSCRTISWNEQQKLCLVSSSDVTHDNNAFDKLSEDASWNTMSVVEYTVFSAMDSSLTPQMTFTQATNLCIERGTVIAGRSDLLDSRSLGLNYYRCTWLSDGTIGYVVQSVQGIGVCSAGSNPWALCILN